MQHLQLIVKTGRIEKERKASINERSQQAIPIYLKVGAGITDGK